MKKQLLFFYSAFIFFASLKNIYAQTGTIPTGSDTTCSNGISFYQKSYGGLNNDIGYYLTLSSDSGYVISGETNSFGNGAKDGIVMKVNARGNTVWSKAIGGGSGDILLMVRQTSDNGFIACGQTKSYGNAAGDAWLVKLDASGNVQWSKKYGDGNVNGEHAFDVIQLSDGGYAFCGAHRFAPGVSESFVVRTDNQGNVLWSKQYGNFSSDNAYGLEEDGNFLLVVGIYYGQSFYDSYVMKLDKSNGAVQWIKGYDAENRSTWFSKIRKTNTGYQVFGVITDNFLDQNQQQCIWNLNTDGTVQNVRKLVIPGIYTASVGWLARPDGGFVAMGGENNNSSDILFSQVNANGSLAWSKKYVRSGRQMITHIVASPYGGYAGVGINNNAGTIPDSNNVYLMRVDSLGDAGICSGINTNDVTIVSPSYTTPNSDVAALGDMTINNPVITVGVMNFAPAIRTLCFYCQPKPTGSLRLLEGGTGSHIITLYSNPTRNSLINLIIDAEFNDMAEISVIDWHLGNFVFKSSVKPIYKGKNQMQFNLNGKLSRNRFYVVKIRFKDYEQSLKIFSID